MMPSDDIYKEIKPEDGLDRELILSNFSGFPIETFSKRYSMNIPSIMVKRDKDIGMLYYFFRDTTERDLEIFLKTYGARYEEGIYTLYASSANYPEYNFLADILQIPSVVPDISYILDGVHFFHFRFHHSVTTQLSQLLISEKRPRQLIIEKMDSYRDKRNNIEWFIKSYRPYVFEFLLNNSEYTGIRGNYNAEIKGVCTSSIRRVVFYGNPEGINNATKIDINLMEGDFNLQFLDLLYGKFNGVRLPIYSNLLTARDGKIASRIIVPEMYKRNLIERLKEADMGSYEIEITRAEMYEKITECTFPRII
ncbi:hypothetical protein ACNF40_07415 [Cuniculiplasma sp. SKW4]|uniref:hypothetical protein n=1 Tax=Cuniculiplasma sp. SKW4 TaxID=3400171 RepID=UPI003FD3FE2D